MSITLTPEQEAVINQKLQSGRYTSAADVLDEGLRLLEEAEMQQPKLEKLRAEIDKAAAQIERGEFTEWESAAALTEYVRAEGRQRLIIEREGRNR
jgi:antitoxin ParD1/3/4